MKRSRPFLSLPFALAITLLCACSNQNDISTISVENSTRAMGVIDPLLFQADDFIVKTKTVITSEGEKQVTFHSYMHVPYVANPIDLDYQSLNVNVPVDVNGIAIDASNAPILFKIPVGGYMSSSNNPNVENPRGPGGPGFMGPPPSFSQGINISSNTDLALSAGFVVVTPGVRGRDNQADDGAYYGKAPAAIVDLKAAIRYIRHNQDVMPGNSNWIVSTGVSAGGALSALLGASGNSEFYDEYLKEIGAADESDSIFASADFCPIMDLEHADMAYEWMWGELPARGTLVDQNLSKQLKEMFAEYQTSLNIQGQNNFGALNADNYDDYLLQEYLIPSANKFLSALNPDQRNEYLDNNQWITWSNQQADFQFIDFLEHVGRMKGLPAFDDFNRAQPEPILFGTESNNARHFSEFSLQQGTGNPEATISDDLQHVVNLMNPMYFINQNNEDMANHWWIRHGTSDAHTSLTVITNLAESLENIDKNVDALLYWDALHGADEDPEEFIAWVNEITGFSN